MEQSGRFREVSAESKQRAGPCCPVKRDCLRDIGSAVDEAVSCSGAFLATLLLCWSICDRACDLLGQLQLCDRKLSLSDNQSSVRRYDSANLKLQGSVKGHIQVLLPERQHIPASTSLCYPVEYDVAELLLEKQGEPRERSELKLRVMRTPIQIPPI